MSGEKTYISYIELISRIRAHARRKPSAGGPVRAAMVRWTRGRDGRPVCGHCGADFARDRRLTEAGLIFTVL